MNIEIPLNNDCEHLPIQHAIEFKCQLCQTESLAKFLSVSCEPMKCGPDVIAGRVRLIVGCDKCGERFYYRLGFAAKESALKEFVWEHRKLTDERDGE